MSLFEPNGIVESLFSFKPESLIDLEYNCALNEIEYNLKMTAIYFYLVYREFDLQKV